MTRAADRLLDDLADMSDAEFEQVYEMAKRQACVRFDVEAYTVGYQDAWTMAPEDNGFHSRTNRDLYALGYREATEKRANEIADV
jgi:hypothetical protein